MYENKLFRLLILFAWVFIISPAASFSTNTNKLDSLLSKIDFAIDNQDVFIRQKEAFIDKLKRQLDHPNFAIESKYMVYKQLTDEYEAYQADSLKLYSKKRLEAAFESLNQEWIINSKINWALVQGKTGLFQSAIDSLNRINKDELSKQQLISYYNAYSDTYFYWTEFMAGMDVSTLIEKRQNIQDSLLKLLPVNSYNYIVHYSTKYIETGEYDKAEAMLLSIFSKLKYDSRDYAVLTSWLAFLYEKSGNIEKQKEYLAISALADIQGVIMENTSLRILALLLFNEGEVHRADIYILKKV